MKAEAGSLLVQASDIVGTTIPVTGLGFTPKAIIFTWSGRGEAADALGRATARPGYGFTNGIAGRAFCSGYTEDAVATSNTSRYLNDVAPVGRISTADAQDGLLDLDSLDADGFTMIVDQVFGADQRIHFLAIGSADLTDTFFGNFVEQNAIGNQSITGVGFQPDALLFLSVASGGAAPVLGNNLQNTIGGMVDATLEGVDAITSRDGQASATSHRYNRNVDEAYATIAGGGAVNARFEFVSMDADGFTVNHLEADNDRVFFLALKSTDAAFHIGAFDTRTDGANIVVTGLGFKPAGLIFVSHNAVESTADTSQASNIRSVGLASSPTKRGAHYVSDISGEATMRVASAVEFDAVYIRTDEAAAPAITGLMDLVSKDPDGFTCVMDDPDPTAAQVLFFALGAAEVDPIEQGVSGKWRWRRQQLPVKGGIRA